MWKHEAHWSKLEFGDGVHLNGTRQKITSFTLLYKNKKTKTESVMEDTKYDCLYNLQIKSL